MYCFLACICTAMLKQATTLALRKWSCVPWRLSTATHQVRLVEFTDRILRVVLLVHLDPFLHRVLTNLNHVVEPLLPSPETTATCKTTKLWNKEREVCEKTVAKGKHCRYIPYCERDRMPFVQSYSQIWFSMYFSQYTSSFESGTETSLRQYRKTLRCSFGG